MRTAAGVVALVPRQAAQSPGAAPVRPAITLTAAQRTLYRLSSVAANASPGRGRYVVMREIQDSYKRTSVIDSATGDLIAQHDQAKGELSEAHKSALADAAFRHEQELAKVHEDRAQLFTDRHVSYPPRGAGS